MSAYADQIAALEAGLASGEVRIMSDGDMVIYRGITDIMRGIDYFRRLQASAEAAGGNARPATTLAIYDPGL